ncbi:unnamed protein product [Caenorhabditis nigoni]
MYQRRILEMNGKELRALTAIVLPGRKGDKLKIGEMQEMCIKWLFSNGLSINHVFEIHEDVDGRVFCVMRNSEACLCCPKESESGTLRVFDNGPIGDNFKRTPSPVRKPKEQEKKKEEEKEPKVKFELPSSPDPPTVSFSKPSAPTNKVAPITVQPTILTISDKKKEEEEEKKNQSSCAYCKRECGLCIVTLSSPIFKPLLHEFLKRSFSCNRISFSTQYFDFLLIATISIVSFGAIFLILWADFLLNSVRPGSRKRN